MILISESKTYSLSSLAWFCNRLTCRIKYFKKTSWRLESADKAFTELNPSEQLLNQRLTHWTANYYFQVCPYWRKFCVSAMSDCSNLIICSLRSLLAFDLRHWSMYCHPGNSWNSAATAITLVWGKLKSALIRHVCCQWSPYQRKKIKIIIPTNLFLHLHISKSCGLRVRGLLTSHKVSVK